MNRFKKEFTKAKDAIILWKIRRDLKKAYKKQVEMFDKISKLWQ